VSKHISIPLAAAAALVAACNLNSPTDPSTSAPRTFQAPSLITDEELGKIRGIGGIARASELSVQEVKAIVDAFCSTPPEE
jgi:hypothetical protein